MGPPLQSYPAAGPLRTCLFTHRSMHLLAQGPLIPTERVSGPYTPHHHPVEAHPAGRRERLNGYGLGIR